MISSIQRSLIVLVAIACQLLVSGAALAAYPTARINPNMVFDEALGRVVLFGGVTDPDSARVRYELNDTWEWTGRRWIRVYTDHSPPGRSSFAMAYDSPRQQVVIFGGAIAPLDQRDLPTFLDDTWAFRNGDWSRIDTPSRPSPRSFAAAAYDPIHDRVWLFGGANATEALYDTWQFDGTTWTAVSTNSPKVTSPLLTWDPARNELILVGLDPDARATAMYRWNDGWERVTADLLPTCTVGGRMVYQEHNQKVLLVGGQCANGGIAVDTWEWDGTSWVKLDLGTTQGSITQFAMAYDGVRKETIVFAGSAFFGSSSTTSRFRDGTWATFSDTFSPGPRSLPLFAYDADARVSWLYGGLNESGNFFDLWRLSGGSWERIVAEDAPSICGYPVGGYDPERRRLVVLCESGDVYEFDGSKWFSFPDLKDKPQDRRFSSMAYFPQIRKFVLFGGYGVSYLDETWTWDGTIWTRIGKGKKAPTKRGLGALFYDPRSSKMILFGGIGRANQFDSVTRFDDMWSFDGTSWTEMSVTANPGPHYGSQVAYNPETQKTLLFGGKNDHEEYVSDQWEWNGTAWTQLNPAVRPAPRMNGGFVYNAATGEYQLFGGYAGLYFSELWRFSGTWSLKEEPLVRRRGATLAPGTSEGLSKPPSFSP